MHEPIPTENNDRQTIESLRSQARRKKGLEILTTLGSVATGVVICGIGLYSVETHVEAGSLDKDFTELAFIGVGLLATATGCLFARDMQRQANELTRRASELAQQVIATHLAEPAQVTLPPVSSGQQAEKPPLIVLLPEEVATLPTSNFVPSRPLYEGPTSK